MAGPSNYTNPTPTGVVTVIAPGGAGAETLIPGMDTGPGIPAGAQVELTFDLWFSWSTGGGARGLVVRLYDGAPGAGTLLGTRAFADNGVDSTAGHAQEWGPTDNIVTVNNGRLCMTAQPSGVATEGVYSDTRQFTTTSPPAHGYALTTLSPGVALYTVGQQQSRWETPTHLTGAGWQAGVTTTADVDLWWSLSLANVSKPSTVRLWDGDPVPTATFSNLSSGVTTVVTQGVTAETIVPGMDATGLAAVPTRVQADLWTSTSRSGVAKGAVMRLYDGAPGTGTVLKSVTVPDVGDQSDGHRAELLYDAIITPTSGRICATVQQTAGSPTIFSDTRWLRVAPNAYATLIASQDFAAPPVDSSTGHQLEWVLSGKVYTPTTSKLTTTLQVTGSGAATVYSDYGQLRLTQPPTAPPATTGALAATLPRFTAAAAGTRALPATTGALGATLPRFTITLGGTYTSGRAGTLAATLPRFSATLAGTHTPPPRTAALAAVLPVFSAHLAATVPVQAGRLRPFTASLRGQVAVIYATDTTYRNDSYTYGGAAEVDYAAPVAPPPPGLVRRDVRRVHQSLPTPDLVRGRPQ